MYEAYQEAHDSFLNNLFSLEHSTGTILMEPAYSYIYIPLIVSSLFIIFTIFFLFKTSLKRFNMIKGILLSITLISFVFVYFGYVMFQNDYDTLKFNYNHNQEKEIVLEKENIIFHQTLKSANFSAKDIRQIVLTHSLFDNCHIDIISTKDRKSIEIPLSRVDILHLKSCNIFDKIELPKPVIIEPIKEQEPLDFNLPPQENSIEEPVPIVFNDQDSEHYESFFDYDVEIDNEESNFKDNIVVINPDEINPQNLLLTNPHSSDNKGKIQIGSNDLILSIIQNDTSLNEPQKEKNPSLGQKTSLNINTTKDEILEFLENYENIKIIKVTQ